MANLRSNVSSFPHESLQLAKNPIQSDVFGDMGIYMQIDDSSFFPTHPCSPLDFLSSAETIPDFPAITGLV